MLPIPSSLPGDAEAPPTYHSRQQGDKGMAEGITQGGGIKRSTQAQQSILQRDQSRGLLGVDTTGEGTAAPILSHPCHGMGPSAPRPLALASSLPAAFSGAKPSCVGQCPSCGEMGGPQKGRGHFGTETHCPQC